MQGILVFRLFSRHGAPLVLAGLLASGTTRAAPRPFWPLPSDVAGLRETHKVWAGLDETGARSHAERLVAREAHSLDGMAEQLVGLARASGEAHFADKAAILLDAMLADLIGRTGGAPAAAITGQGSADTVNLQVRDAAFRLALRYTARGDVDDAERVKRILLQFADVMPGWPLWDRGGEPRDQSDRSFHRQWDGRGIWGVWHHMDLERSYPLLRAYDLVHDVLSPQERERIEEGIFRHQKALSDRWEVRYTNMLGHRLLGMARFGLVLPEPAYVHEAVQIHHRMLYAGFFPDGTYREVSPSYHTMPVSRLTGRLAPLLLGYSDPVGYRHPETGRRIDDLDLAAQYARHYERWWTAWDKLTLPNGRTLAVNDATAGRQAWWTRNPPHTAPRLLGASGIAMLGTGGEETPQQLYLLFADTHGHEHRDALHITWFAHGREVFSETDYRPLPDSGSSREWQASTAGHNTVVIDGRNQHGRFSGTRRELTEDDAMLDIGHAWHSRQRAMNHGNLTLFDPGWARVQAVEAEAERAYSPTATLYRRTLVLVDTGEGNGYLVDIFRVRGGMEHEYMLHGCLDEVYTLEAGIEMEEAEGTIHDYVRLHSRARAIPPFALHFGYGDGVRVISRVLSPTRRDGTGQTGVELRIGTAPAMRRQGEADFVSMLRRGGTELEDPGHDNLFVLVHEAAGTGETAIASAELMPIESDDPEAVALRVTRRDGGEDVFLSTQGAGRVSLEDGTHFTGRLAYVGRRDGRTTAARVMDGRSLVTGCGTVNLADLPAFSGPVLATRRMENGDAVDGIVVAQLPAGAGDLAGRTIFVEMDDGRDFVWAYRIEEVREEDGRTVLRVEHDPGFEIRDEGRLTKLVYHPGWGFRSPAFYRIAGVGHWEED